MKYTIGIGVLFDENSYNAIRDIELELSERTNNFSGLGQPPHVTVKRPFAVEGIEDIKKCESIMQDVATRAKSFQLELSGIGSFSNTVLFLRPEQNKNLEDIHDNLINEIESVFPSSKTVHEGDNMIFHSTLAMDLSPQEFHIAKNYMDSIPHEKLSFMVRVQKIGLFLGVDNNTHWITLSERSFQNPSET